MFSESRRNRRTAARLLGSYDRAPGSGGRAYPAALVWLLGGLLLFCGWLWLRGRYGVARAQPVQVVPGVIYRYLPEGSALLGGLSSDALLLDIDLRAPGLRVEIAAESVGKQAGGAVAGSAYTVRDWCIRRHAVAGVNGGFFGRTFGESKEVMGMLKTDGQIRNPGRKVRSPSNPANQFVRAALGFTAAGMPRIGWLTTNRDNLVHAVNRPLNPTSNVIWALRSAVACGPRLIAGGTVVITDHEERLVSPRAAPRTFVAYDVEGSGRSARPRHLLIGVAMAMRFADVASLAQRYFRAVHGTSCFDALCLDGGSSSQLIYRDPLRPLSDAYVDARPGFVTVPTALLIYTDTP